MSLEGHKNGRFDSSLFQSGSTGWHDSSIFPDVVTYGLDSINDIPLLCAQKHAVCKIVIYKNKNLLHYLLRNSRPMYHQIPYILHFQQ